MKKDYDADDVIFTYREPIKYFHSLDEEGNIQYQGFIDQMLDGGGASGVLFEWVLGEMNGRVNFTSDGFNALKLYDSDVEMKAYARKDTR